MFPSGLSCHIYFLSLTLIVPFQRQTKPIEYFFLKLNSFYHSYFFQHHPWISWAQPSLHHSFFLASYLAFLSLFSAFYLAFPASNLNFLHLISLSLLILLSHLQNLPFESHISTFSALNETFKALAISASVFSYAVCELSAPFIAFAGSDLFFFISWFASSALVGQSQGLLYKHLCHSIMDYLGNSFIDPLVKIFVQRRHA